VSSSAGSPSAFAALHDRSFAWFWSAAVVSNIGTWTQQVTVPFVIYEVTGSSVWLGASVLATNLPQVIASPLAGATADRVSRRTVLMVAILVQIATSCLLAIMWMSHVRAALPLLAVVFVSNFGAGYQLVAWQSIIPSLVSRDALSSAIRLNSIQFALGRSLGPALGGFVLGTAGPAWAFVVNAASFAGVFAVVATLPASGLMATGQRTSVLRDMREGLRYLHAHPIAQRAIVNGSVVVLIPFALVQVGPLLASQQFHVGDHGYAALMAANGVGALLGAATLSFAGNRWRRSVATVAGFGLGVLGSALVGATGWLGVGIVAFTIIGASQSFISVTQNTVLQIRVTDAYRGRAMSVYLTCTMASAPAGSFLFIGVAHLVPVAVVSEIFALIALAYIGTLVRRPAVLHGLDRDDMTGSATVEIGGALPRSAAERRVDSTTGG